MNEEYKCKDCKWLTGQKNIRGIECMNPVLQEKWNKAKTLWMGELRKDSARYKQGSALACKKFEAKESEHMGRYIKFDDAVKVMACEMYAEAQSQGYDADGIEDFMPEAKAWLNDAPSIDIVRCKECELFENGWCNRHDVRMNDDDFCSYGERKESE